MIAVSIYVKDGEAWVLGGSEGVNVKLEDADGGETVYYQVEGSEVYEIESRTTISLIDKELKYLED